MNGPTMVTLTPASPPTRPAAAPRPAARPAAVKPEADPAAMTARLVAWVRLYWLMVLFCGSLLGAGFAYAAWTLLPSKYESYAQLRVASSPFTVTNSKDPNRSRTDFGIYLRTNAKLLHSEFVLSKALSQEVDGRRISELPTIKGQPHPVQFLDEQLEVGTAEGSEIITLTLRGGNPDDIRAIVNAVQKAFMEEVIEKEIKERVEFLNRVETILVRTQTTLNEKLPRPAANPMAGAPPLAVPPGLPEAVRKKQAENLLGRAAVYEQLVLDLPLQIALQKGRLEAERRKYQALTQGEPAKESVEAAEKDPEVQTLQFRERMARTKYNQHRSVYNNPDAPILKGYLEQADSLAAEAEKLKKKKVYEKELARRQGKADGLAPKLEEEEFRLRELEAKLAEYQRRLAVARADIDKLPPDPAKDADGKPAGEKKPPILHPDDALLMADGEIFHGLAHHAAGLRLDIQSPKRVTVQQTASTPTQKDTRKQVLGTVVAGLMGFAVVGLGVLGYETKVKKVCGLPDLKATVPTPVVGVVPWQPDADLGRDPIRRADVTESIDKLRSYVSQTWIARGATTVAVTSAIGDEGKAFAAFGLASSLAAGGYKTLLVDFDLRHPGLHAQAGVENRAGVCELLRGEADFRRTIQVLPGGLHLLTAGTWSDEARAAAVGGRLEALLGRLREPFDCVVLHAHALLTAAETVEVARRCEVVLLCTLYRDTRLPLLRRAADRLAAMEVPYTGLVYLGATPQEALC
jgi:Mrp family chromosome partitioning ATPase/capsular polysaccharide biosynthesis protein